jgi:hypothetical protein
MAVGRGFRAAVVTVTGFALGLWLFHNIEVAVFSGFAGIAITGIADFRGRRRFRVAAVGASTVLGAVLVVFGTLLSTRSAGSQMVVIFLVVAAVLLAGRSGCGHALLSGGGRFVCPDERPPLPAGWSRAGRGVGRPGRLSAG